MPDHTSSSSASSSGSAGASSSSASKASRGGGGGGWSGVDVLSLVVAILIAGVLQLAAFAKLVSTDPRKIVAGTDWLAERGMLISKPIVEGYAIGVLEMVLASFLLVAFRWKHAWTLMAVFFLGLAGFATFAFVEGRPCGCFGDVIKLPKGFSIWMDLGIAGAALGIMGLKGVKAKGFIVTIVLGVLAFGGGYLYGKKSEWPATSEYKSDLEVRPRDGARPPHSSEGAPDGTDGTDGAAGGDGAGGGEGAGSAANGVEGSAEAAGGDGEYFLEVDPSEVGTRDPENTTNAARTLVASNLLTEEREDGLGTAYYIFIHDPNCSVCERLKPMVYDEMARFEEEGNPFIRVREFTVPDLTEKLRIDHWAWTTTPTVILIRDGEILFEESGEFVTMPDQAETMLMGGELE
ncbi:MAG: thioredoxin family protein [Phycisphaerales bacterium]